MSFPSLPMRFTARLQLVHKIYCSHQLRLGHLCPGRDWN